MGFHALEFSGCCYIPLSALVKAPDVPLDSVVHVATWYNTVSIKALFVISPHVFSFLSYAKHCRREKKRLSCEPKTVLDMLWIRDYVRVTSDF